MLLAGDIGGTKTNLALYSIENGQITAHRSASFSSQAHATLTEIVRAFLMAGPEKVNRACFGVAGPVRDGVVQVTNLPWVVDAALLRQELGLEAVGLLNDLEANAWGIQTLLPSELLSLNPSAQPGQPANRALIAAGTGLGEAGLYWDGAKYHPFACEGGHASFSPNDSIGDELLIFMRQEHGHVSWERVLSGMGIRNLYRFFRQRSGTPEPVWLQAEFQQSDFAAVVTHAGLSGKDQVCVDTLDCFTRNYGSEAGNVGLKFFALGGIYIGGGIAPKILPKMQSSLFLDAFYHKGRLSPLLKTTPVYLILNDKTALQGAAWHAAHAI